MAQGLTGNTQTAVACIDISTSSLFVLFRMLKKTYYNDLVDLQMSDSKHLFKVSKQLMHLDKYLPLPKSSSTKDLAENFNNFFISRIKKIRNGFSDAKPDRITHNW